MLRRPLRSRLFPSRYRYLHLNSVESNDRKSISLILQSYSKSKSLQKCKEIHSALVITGLVSDTYFANTLLSFYSRSGDLFSAHHLFNQTPHKNVVSWTSIITAYVRRGSFEAAFKMFGGMIDSGEKPNQFTFSIAIHACTNLQGLQMGFQIHGLIVRFGLETDEFAGSSLVDMYFKMGLLDHACCVFSRLFYRDVVSWNVMISGFSKNGDSVEVLRLFSGMQSEGLTPNDFTCTSLLKCCHFSREVEQMHGFVLKSGIEFDTVVGSALVDTYFKCGQTDSGRKVLDLMLEKDGFAWSSAISGYMRNGEGDTALVLYREMRRHGMEPDQHALSGILKACVDIQDIEAGIQIHTGMIKNGYQRDCFVASVLLDLYSSFSKMGDAEGVFRGIYNKDTVSWNAMIMGYAQIEDFANVCFNLFRELLRTVRIKPDCFTFLAVLKSLRSKIDLEMGRMTHSQIIKFIHSSETNVGNAVLNMYSKCEAVEDSRRAFDAMIFRDEISWNTMIGSYVQNGLEEEALRIYNEMAVAGFCLSQFTFASCLAACSGLVALDVGRQFHSLMIKAGFRGDVYVGSSVMDMYAKCGNMEDSIKAFHELNSSNIVTFNTLISGLAQHGRAKEAIQLFKELESMEITPTKMTFIGVLTACSHVGLVEESMNFFNMMCWDYGIEPESEHYCCLVDVFGRAGRIGEAYQIIGRVKTDLGVSVWRTLLSACRNYGNVIIGEESAKKVMELEPDDHSSYVLLSNLYSEAGKWEEAWKLRAKMAEIRVRKEPGSSWVIIRNGVHQFSVGDFSHPEGEKILRELNILNNQIKTIDV